MPIAIGVFLAAAACSVSVSGLSSPPSQPTPVTKPTIQAFSPASGQPSDNWAGYVVQGASGIISDVSAQWVVPAVACTDQDAASAIWVGIDGTTDKTVEQIGTEQDCQNGQPAYGAWVELFPRPSREIATISIAAGDTVSTDVHFDGKGKFTLSMNDLTTAQTY